MGSLHLQTVAAGNIPGMRVTDVCDINPEKLKTARAEYPDIAAFGNYTKLLEDSDTDAVIIAVPHPLHA